MKYATLMGELYVLNDHNWLQFLLAVSRGESSGETLCRLGHRRGDCPGVTDWTADDAKMELEQLQQRNLRLRIERRKARAC